VESNNRAITFQISLGGFNWLCSTVYARPNLAASYKLWEYLMRFKASISIPWLMIGDFNEVAFILEIRGVYFNKQRAHTFFNFTQTCAIHDIEAEGNKYT